MATHPDTPLGARIEIGTERNEQERSELLPANNANYTIETVNALNYVGQYLKR